MSKILFNLLALVAALAPAAQAAPSPSEGETAKPEPADLRAASFRSIESSWLEVPRHCKAKGFNADPAPVARERLSAEVAAIYGTIPA